MQAAFDATGLSPPSPSAIKHIVGLSLDVAIGRLAPDITASVRMSVVAAFKSAFNELHAQPGERAPLYPGVRAALDALDTAGYLLGIATGKGQSGLQAVLKETGLGQRFVTLQTADRAAGKPAPEMLLQAMAETGAEPADTVMIGDTTYDMEMAANAQVGAIGVAWGYHPVADLLHAGAKTVIDHFVELPDALGI